MSYNIDVIYPALPEGLVHWPPQKPDHQHIIIHSPLQINNMTSIIEKLNRIGDKRQPCFNPEDTLNQSILTPLILTLHWTWPYIDCKILSFLSAIPKCCSSWHKRFQLILSKSLQTSIKAICSHKKTSV